MPSHPCKPNPASRQPAGRRRYSQFFSGPKPCLSQKRRKTYFTNLRNTTLDASLKRVLFVAILSWPGANT
jgi:hypothetical protein